jgi:hypothetical protein
MKNLFPRGLLALSVMAAMLTLSPLTMAEVLPQEIIDAKQESQIWTTFALSPYLRASRCFARNTIDGFVAQTSLRALFEIMHSSALE